MSARIVSQFAARRWRQQSRVFANIGMVAVTLTITAAAVGSDADATAYATALGLSGNEAATVERIVLELKGTYNGAGKVNTSGTNYWGALTDAWLFDRGLNAYSSAAGGIKSLKLTHNVTANTGATLNTSDGLATIAGTDTPNGAQGTVATLTETYTTGVTFLAREDPGPARKERPKRGSNPNVCG